MGLIGCGYWGKNHLRALLDMDGVTLGTICDTIKPKVKIPSTVNFTTDYKQILSDDSTNAVVLATPTNTHYLLAHEFLSAGKHVFVEKPIATKPEQARDLCNLASEKRLQLMVGEIFRFNPAVKYIKGLIESGELGELRYIESRRVGLGPVRTDVSALWDLATHDIYISSMLAGMQPESVTYQGMSHNGSLDDIVCLNLRYRDKPNPDILSTIYVNWEHPVKERKLIVGGTKKAVLFDDVQPSEKVVIYERGVDYLPSTGDFAEFQASTRDGNIIIPKIKLVQPLEEELKNFVACIQGKEKCASDGYAGLHTVNVLEAAEFSRQGGGAETFIEYG